MCDSDMRIGGENLRLPAGEDAREYSTSGSSNHKSCARNPRVGDKLPSGHMWLFVRRADSEQSTREGGIIHQ